MLRILIYRIVLFVFILLISSVASNASEEISIERPKKIIGYFQSGNVDKIYNQFDSTMANLLSIARLEPIWGQLSKNYGEFIGIGLQDSASSNGNLVTNTDLNFEKAVINFMLSFNINDNKITGMYISEQEKKQLEILEEKPLPSYIDTTKFIEEEITVKDIYDLNGKLTIPKVFDKNIVFILVHGSGPQDMDGTFGKHKFLQNIAWGLSSNGFATLRYNKLTLQHGRKLVREIPEMTQDDEYNNSISSAIKLIKNNSKLKNCKIVLLGHSQGASAITSFATSKDIDGMILLSGSPRKLYDLYTEQLEYIFGLEGGVTSSENTILTKHKEKVEYFNKNKKRLIPKDSLPLELNYEYLVHLDIFDPIENLNKSDIPTLIVNGGHDYQVTFKDYNLWKNSLNHKDNIKFDYLENVNHIFGEIDRMSVPSDYRKYRPIAPKLFELIKQWIKNI